MVQPASATAVRVDDPGIGSRLNATGSVASGSSWSGPMLVRERGAAGYQAVGAAVGAAADVTPEPVPDPFDDADALDALGDEIATLAAHIHAADQRLLTLIAEFDRRGGWKLGGYPSCAHWVAARTGIDLGASRERVRAARVLVGLPETSASMARGELSFSAVRALTRVATPDNEADLLELARGCTTAELERVVRAWKRGSRADEAARERELHDARTFSVFPDDEGMYRVKGRLPAEVGALLMRAVEAAGDALYRAERTARGAGGGSPDAPAPEESRRAAARRRADALGLLAERAMAAGFGRAAGSEDGAEPGAEGEGPSAAPVSGTRAERYQVVLHVGANTLLDQEGAAAEAAPGSDTLPLPHDRTRSELEDGTRVSAETSRRLACDAARVTMTHDAAGSILHVGRRTRTIPPALRRALDARDRGCRFPGCHLRFCDAHHVRHWADGGETSLANCLLLCRHHHRLVHEEGWGVQWWGEGRPAFVAPRGGLHYDGRWQPPTLGPRPVEALMDGFGRRSGEGPPAPDPSEQDPSEQEPSAPEPAAEARPAAPRFHAWTASARWERAEDVPDEVLFRALEALG